MSARNNGKRHATQQSLNGAIKSICDVMRPPFPLLGHPFAKDFSAARMPSVTASPDGRPFTAASASFSL